MKKYFLTPLVFLFFIFTCLPSFADSQSGPVALLQSIADQLIDRLKVNKTTLKTNPSLVYSLANHIVVPHADLDEMSKRVLPPATWNNATISQRAKFKNEFTNLLVRTYASALAEYSNQTVKFFPVRGGYEGKSSVRVDSQIVRDDGPNISMNYRLVKENSGWKLYDMTVEGVSLLESFRSQFADRLSNGNMSDLIQELEKHNAEKS